MGLLGMRVPSLPIPCPHVSSLEAPTFIVPIMIGQRIKEMRKARDMRQSTLAARSGVYESYISSLESGKVPNPSVHQIVKIAKGLGVSVDSLVNGQEEKDGLDEHFIHEYLKLDPLMKERFRAIMKIMYG